MDCISLHVCRPPFDVATCLVTCATHALYVSSVHDVHVCAGFGAHSTENVSVVQANWDYNQPADEFELFDLDADKWELNNIYKSASMRATLPRVYHKYNGVHIFLFWIRDVFWA